MKRITHYTPVRRSFSVGGLLITLLLFTACSTTTHQTSSHPKTTPVAHERVVDVQHANQGLENDVENIDSPAITLVSEGIQKFKEELIEDAEWKFEEAINLDADYGPAYYWLARVKYRLSDLDQCFELLKKATSLLKNSEEWVERIQEFTDFLNSAEPSE